MGDAEFPTTPAGYAAAIGWAQASGRCDRRGGGHASYGAGLTRALQGGGIEVAEVSRPDRAARRRQGKSDPLDAYAAARTALAGHGLADPEGRADQRAQALLTARRGAVKSRTAAINQIKALLVTAPAELRERYRHHTTNTTLIAALARCRPTHHSDPTIMAVLTAAKALAQRVQYLDGQERDLTAHLDTVVTERNPALRAAHGVGPDTAAQLIVTAGTNPDRLRSEAAFAALCGAAPVPASSGKITRHRLSRGGDRAANKALHRIALVRMRSHPPTRDYVTRQIANGRTKKEILRLLKRAIAREMFKLLTRACASMTTATYAPPGKQKTSPSPPSPNTSASDRSPSPDSNADNTETTHSPPPTDTGSPPSSSTPLDP